ncbi:glutamate mutase L [Actinokineospora xionganensis]|uniref:Glutamate mutase L n=1 Tax=Actinokineospora xionganensis TaxID=2684470 RepID=A0ABR7L7M0_9PSEU|nr:glutamate mutase L [Actinokineospora xionganensis]MBC6448386.1 glutamate mutase L [Actinokineospora xionganensis]
MPLLCLDVGSTWTKGALVSPDGDLLGTAQHETTPPEVLDGVAAVTSALGAAEAEVLACSSAGGGLRLAVVGQERLVSAEAGYRVALSAGAKVVHVSSGDLDGAGIRALRADRPDIVLLVGGTDGGDQRVLLHNARKLAANRITVPIVLAGNADAREEALALLAGRSAVATDNVLPDVGELAPGPARKAIRAAFLSHVIGGKGLSRGPRFRSLVRTVTPDAVLTGVSRLAGVLAREEEQGAVLVVDVGGATTDVYSAVSTVEGERVATVALPADRRTVEGDIGMRWSAPGIVAEAVVERLISDSEDLAASAKHRAADVDFIPSTTEESEVDIRLAALAAILAVRRHLRLVDGQLGPRGAGLLVLSGGVFRHATPEGLARVEELLRADPILRPVLRTARVVVDRDYVLAPAGLLADVGRGAAADRLLESSLVPG